ncbi:hypothetical protein FHU38_002407 [Saccharomonospora amisosensis]|uniref:Uncharacterized protein n=1 Tax=Saccharomonospora amisosensis TaxID=1128677 RepID=A0A7X5UPW9_9PSEU|nr:hypothetical protein [Saccharomonospora amisosensis]NIJ12063.1 hypothetical protein [Saccharomonospora amisosensis]
MGLKNVWISTLSDGLIRADQVVGIESHRTPELTGKVSRWLLDVTLAVPAGSGNTDGWDVAELHRTLAQSDTEPRGVPGELARTLDRLGEEDEGGVLSVVARDGALRLEFTPFEQERDRD